MDIVDSQKQIIKNYWNDVAMIQVFINNNNFKHNQCRNIYRELSSKLVILLEGRILSTRMIDKIHNTFYEYLIDIFEIDTDLGILYYGYIQEFFECYKGDCEDNELFESAANIRNFLEFYNSNNKKFNKFNI